MTAKEAISPVLRPENGVDLPHVDGGMPLIEVLPRLLESTRRLLEVDESGEAIGVIDQTSMLDALGRMIATRDDSSVVTVECTPGEYSASRLSHAVEDADVHLVDLLTVPAESGKLHVTMRVRCEDPTSVVHNLERYGYDVIESHGESSRDATVALERLLSLRALMDV